MHRVDEAIRSPEHPKLLQIRYFDTDLRLARVFRVLERGEFGWRGGVRRYLEGWLARREPSLISCCGETYYLEMGNESGDRASRAMGLALVDCETR